MPDLGFLIILARNQYDTPLVLVAVITLASWPGCCMALVALLERRVLAWQAPQLTQLLPTREEMIMPTSNCSVSSVLLLLMAPRFQAQDTPADVTLFPDLCAEYPICARFTWRLTKAISLLTASIFTMQYGDEPDGVDLIAADQLQFGFISGEQVIQARAKDRPVVFVYEWFQKYPVGIVVPADSDYPVAWPISPGTKSAFRDALGPVTAA